MTARNRRAVLLAGYAWVAIASIVTIARLKKREAELRRDIDAAGAIVVICDRGWRHHPPSERRVFSESSEWRAYIPRRG